MLGKLLKHEFRATARIMGPLYLVLLVLSACANVSVRLLDTTSSRLLNILGGLILFLFGVGIVGVCIMTLVLMIERFQKNLLGDEGYVMFTLPASIHAQVWAKIIPAVVWSIASVAAVALSALIATFRVAYVSRLFSGLRNLLSQITGYYALNGAAFIAEALVLTFASGAAVCLVFYAAMAVGHSFANHKSLLSVAFFFAFTFGLQFLGLTSAFSFGGFNFNGVAAVHAFMGVMIAMSLVVCAIFYAVTVLTLQRRLNLD